MAFSMVSKNLYEEEKNIPIDIIFLFSLTYVSRFPFFVVFLRLDK